MALSLGINVGTRVRVGDHCVEVKATLPGNRILLALDKGGEVMVSELETTAIFPGVKVCFGKTKSGKGERLAFEAPREIAVARIKTDRGRDKRHGPDLY
jgi:hypothetical protein